MLPLHHHLVSGTCESECSSYELYTNRSPPSEVSDRRVGRILRPFLSRKVNFNLDSQLSDDVITKINCQHWHNIFIYNHVGHSSSLWKETNHSPSADSSRRVIWTICRGSEQGLLLPSIGQSDPTIVSSVTILLDYHHPPTNILVG